MAFLTRSGEQAKFFPALKAAALRGSGGYTFPLMLIILVAVAFAASRLEVATSYRLKRDKEEELLFRGIAYMRAIRAFYAANALEKRYPRTLEELVSDPRLRGRQYIRQLYKDPMTGRDFNLILSAEGTITGVVSASTEAPFRTVGFGKELEGFKKAARYADWQFNVKPKPVPSQDAKPANPPAASEAPAPQPVRGPRRPGDFNPDTQ
jgi:hypothetical protein